MRLKVNNRCFWVFLACLLLVLGRGEAEELVFRGISDVSAAVFLDATHFAAADDETNCLRIYDVNIPGYPVSQPDLNAFLEIEGRFPEADIEAAARVGERIYWISSHGRNSDGKMRPNRYRFFCTKIKATEKLLQLEPVGRPCTNLIPRFLAHSSTVYETIADAARLDKSLSKKERKKLAPKKDGLNIEGLSFYPPNKSLLIGLRNPLFSSAGKKGGDAIVIELLNPEAVVDDGAAAQFGEVLFWNLDNRGIRGIEYSSRQKMFFILAGAIDSETTFALYRWDGDFLHQPVLMHVWDKEDSFNPEGIAEEPSNGLLWIFSDDGAIEVPVDSAQECMAGEMLDNGTCPNKHLKNPARKTFRVRKCSPMDVEQ